MSHSRITIGILGFLTLVFCVDTAISESQLFRRRFDPCWQQRHCCPPPCCIFTETECGECSLFWDGSQWIEEDACNALTCCCTFNVTADQGSSGVLLTGTCNPISGISIDSDHVFAIALSCDSEFNNPQEYLRFKVPAGSSDINMARITLDANGNIWKITISFRDTEWNGNSGNPGDEFIVARPPGTKDRLKIMTFGNPSGDSMVFASNGPSTRTAVFKKFQVVIERDF